MLTVAEVATHLERGQTYIKANAEKFGGRKVKGRWAFPLSALQDAVETMEV